jgi:hypothetical protein
MYYGNNVFGANSSEKVHDGFQKTELEVCPYTNCASAVDKENLNMQGS